jgi:hypothetical protein
MAEPPRNKHGHHTWAEWNGQGLDVRTALAAASFIIRPWLNVSRKA